ncbi:hypothetical protein LNKW23_44600 [Paralimibaculum aggregatum]|uniref:Uncharacterized protein n=1 Tax=Paralimibaculum aggregatum TaxID=3036245 RepID=A0ABQ6LT55_9RHOB|nr:hypothetical protein [Limibaculum sp. NKW23]GMG85243.1 hypothetical protein LNKW23_44600 [Limibaculum sp. NKW23]
MRYAEKSFEIRFCAALSAAIMPFNRNPKWFGLTQAQERKKGIDTVLGIGGSLVLFQFKAQSGSRIKIERDQLTKLTSVEKQYPNSTFYVFPEAEDIHAAASIDCMFKEAWCCTPAALDKEIAKSARSAAFTLDAKASALSQASPKKSVAIEKTCKRFGCFCPSSAHLVYDDLRRSPRSLIRFVVGSWEGRDLTDSSFTQRGIGIPIGRDLPRGSMDRGEDTDTKTITSAEMFEDLLGEGAHQSLGPGLRALFIAQ